jgi:hypothetical protein
VNQLELSAASVRRACHITWACCWLPVSEAIVAHWTALNNGEALDWGPSLAALSPSGASRRRGPNELAAVQALGVERKSDPVMPQYLHQVAAPAAEDVDQNKDRTFNLTRRVRL